jgi:hypothetical protein
MNIMDENDRSHLDGFHPAGVNYFRMPIFAHFDGQSYHRRMIRQEWNARKLREDLADRILRSDIVITPSRPKNQQEDIERLLFRLDGDVFCHLEGDTLLVYAPTVALASEVSQRLSKAYGKPWRPKKKTPTFYLLTAGQDGFDAEPVKIERPVALSEQDLDLHYGQEVVAFEHRLNEQLKSRDGGTTILRGEAGTGKTSFIRHLLAKLWKTNRFYYLPAAACRFLSGPDTVSFWVNESRKAPDAKKVVVLEDAEEVLMERGADNRQEVSVLLNAADGLLGDFLKMHVIATVNAPIERLDPAVVRPGRLLAYHDFKRLSRDQAQRLATAKGITLPEQDDYSLAEIYRQEVTGKPKVKQKQLGFAT